MPPEIAVRPGGDAAARVGSAQFPRGPIVAGRADADWPGDDSCHPRGLDV